MNTNTTINVALTESLLKLAMSAECRDFSTITHNQEGNRVTVTATVNTTSMHSDDLLQTAFFMNSGDATHELVQLMARENAYFHVSSTPDSISINIIFKEVTE